MDKPFARARNVLILSAMRHPGELLCGLVLGGLLAVACSDPGAGTLPTPSTSTSPSPTISATMDRTNELISAATHYYDVLVATSLDPTETRLRDFERLIHPQCTCVRVVEFLREQARKGQRIDRPVTIDAPEVATSSASGGTVFLTLNQHAGEVLAKDGRVVERLPASKVKVVLDLRAIDTRLLVSQISERPQ